LGETGANTLQRQEKQPTNHLMQRRPIRTRTCFWAATVSASLCCCFSAFALDRNDAGEIVVAQAKEAEDKKKQGDIDIEQARKLFEEHQKNLQKIQQEQESLKTETKTLETERATLQSKLIEAGRSAQDSERRLTVTEKQLEKLTAQEAEIRLQLNESRTTIGQMLGVMQRMGREPPPVMVTKRSDALKMVRSAMVLSSYFPKFKEEADRLGSRLADLDRVMAETRTRQEQLGEQKTQFARSREEIEMLLVEKRERMRGNFARLDDLKVVASRHTRAVTDLGDLLQRLDAEVAQNSNLAAYEAELKRLGPIVELKPEAKQVAFVQPGRMKPALPFDKVKGQLPLPCAGRKIKSFGTRDETGGKSEGIVVETRGDAQIVSPSDGWVIYAGQFRSYGQLLIINAGGGYHILLAGMDQIYTSVGQFVLAGEPVAVMGKSAPQPAGGAQSRSPSLYIEFRKDARPVDPDPWWSTGVKEG
jgi:septal ring factor EnvC (AmiA/AmiB activator)